MTTEQQEADYERRFNRVGDHLMSTANKLATGLVPVDVAGLLFASGIEFLRQHQTDVDTVKWIRELADALERGKVGFRHTTH